MTNKMLPLPQQLTRLFRLLKFNINAAQPVFRLMSNHCSLMTTQEGCILFLPLVAADVAARHFFSRRSKEKQ